MWALSTCGAWPPGEIKEKYPPEIYYRSLLVCRAETYLPAFKMTVVEGNAKGTYTA
jgi:hypothetical protein